MSFAAETLPITVPICSFSDVFMFCWSCIPENHGKNKISDNDWLDRIDNISFILIY